MKDSEALAAALKEAAERGDILAGACGVGVIVDPTCSLEQRRDRVLDFASAHGADSAEAILSGLGTAGFKDAVAGYTEAHSDLAAVIEYREGMPITMAVLIMAIAQAAGLSAHGLNQPGHFLIQIEGQVFDPMSRLAVSNQRIASAQPATALAIIVRMLNNLRSLAASAQDHGEHLKLIDLQLALIPAGAYRAQLLLDQAGVWERFGSVGMARRVLEAAREFATDAEVQARIEADLAALSGRSETLH